MKKFIFMAAAAFCLLLTFAFTPSASADGPQKTDSMSLQAEIDRLLVENAVQQNQLDLYKRDVKALHKAHKSMIDAITSPIFEDIAWRLCAKACGNAYKSAMNACGPITTTTMENPMSGCHLDALNAWMSCITGCND